MSENNARESLKVRERARSQRARVRVVLVRVTHWESVWEYVREYYARECVWECARESDCFFKSVRLRASKSACLRERERTSVGVRAKVTGRE
jgi:hypothetical protein